MMNKYEAIEGKVHLRSSDVVIETVETKSALKESMTKIHRNHVKC